MMTTGTLPLQPHMNRMPIWHVIPTSTLFITYIIDAWPYDCVRVGNDCNVRTDHVSGRIPYHFDDASIRAAAERLLGFGDAVPSNPEHTWKCVIGKLLGEIAAQRRG